MKHEIGARLKNPYLIITHRLETVQDVQHVVWIDNGRIREQGRPEAINVLGPPDEVMDVARI